uniref:Uncharacterized protein n=1 Tax=Arundo donax TaxID=35708 RepID=A0A0A8YVN2_ARUDO
MPRILVITNERLGTNETHVKEIIDAKKTTLLKLRSDVPQCNSSAVKNSYQLLQTKMYDAFICLRIR